MSEESIEVHIEELCDEYGNVIGLVATDEDGNQLDHIYLDGRGRE